MTTTPANHPKEPAMTKPDRLTDQQLDDTADRAPLGLERERKIRRNYANSAPDSTVRLLLDELDRLRAQRRFLIGQIAKKDAASGAGDRALREFLGGEEQADDGDEITRLRAALEEIRHLHTDSPMGPCPVCIDADAVAAGGDGLVPYPCPTARLAGAKDCDPPHVRAARYEAAGDVMAASLVRDGFGDDEIANMLGKPAARP